MKTIRLKDYGTDLSSRHTASAVRQLITDVDHGVLLDLSGVRSVSHSFADELFAILVLEQGEEWFRSSVTVKDASAQVRIDILKAIQQRSDLQEA